MTEQIPDLLTGTEMCLVAEVPKAGDRWRQVHFNKDIVRQFFNLEPGMDRSITIEQISAAGRVAGRKARQLVFPESNRNSRIELFFGPRAEYPLPPHRPLVAVVEAEYLTYRYRTLMPGDAGYESVLRLLTAGPSIGKGVRRRIVTLDELEAYWPQAALRGGV
jgi:hypothetical protein